MTRPDKIFLLGLPGSGKSTLGKELAERLDRLFVDLDLEIEKAVNKTIRSFFAEEGEERFREVEAKLLKDWCDQPSGFVMATGGGTPCFHNNMSVIQNAGTSIFLDVPPTEIVKRMEKTARAERPLLNQGEEELILRLNQLFSERASFYRQATITLSGSLLDAGQILAQLV